MTQCKGCSREKIPASSAEDQRKADGSHAPETPPDKTRAKKKKKDDCKNKSTKIRDTFARSRL